MKTPAAVGILYKKDTDVQKTVVMLNVPAAAPDKHLNILVRARN